MSDPHTLPRDTAAAAHAVQIASHRRMGGERRLAIGIALSDEVREITLAGIRARHPEYDEEQAQSALFRLLLGEDLYRAAYPGRALLAP